MWGKGATALLSILSVVAWVTPAHGAPTAGVTAEDQRQLIPAYVFPTGGATAANPWHQLCSRMTPGSIIVMNPGSGPGGQVQEPYTEAMGYCREKPRKQLVLGYVYTSYTARPLGDVLADIDTWYRLYPRLDGIFVDEMASFPHGSTAVGAASVKDYYRRIYTHSRRKSADRDELVVVNPGVTATTPWQLDVSDKVVVFEGNRAAYAKWAPEPWVGRRPADQIVQLIHSTPADRRHHVCQLSRARNAGWVDVTDDVMINPWDTVPSYWRDVAPVCS
jgi:spherulation-specific family 4 protein